MCGHRGHLCAPLAELVIDNVTSVSISIKDSERTKEKINSSLFLSSLHLGCNSLQLGIITPDSQTLVLVYRTDKSSSQILGAFNLD